MNTLLLRFVATASLARLTNEGLALALVLIADRAHRLDRRRPASSSPRRRSRSSSTGPLLGPVARPVAAPVGACCACAGVVTAGAAVLLATTRRAGRRSSCPLLGALAMAGVEPLLNGGISAIGGRGAWSTRVFAWDSLAYNVAGLGGPAVVTAVAAAGVARLGARRARASAPAAIALTSLGLTVADAAAPRVPRAPAAARSPPPCG